MGLGSDITSPVLHFLDFQFCKVFRFGKMRFIHLMSQSKYKKKDME